MSAGLLGGSFTLPTGSDFARLVSSLPTGVTIDPGALSGFDRTGTAPYSFNAAGNLFTLPSGQQGTLAQALQSGPLQDIGAFRRYYEGPIEPYLATPNLPQPTLQEWAGTFGGILLGDLQRFQAYGGGGANAELGNFLAVRQQVLEQAARSGFMNDPAFLSILQEGGDPQAALTRIQQLSAAQTTINTVASRNPEWSGYLPGAQQWEQLTAVMPVDQLRQLASTYGPLVFQLLPHELQMVRSLLGGQATNEQGVPLWRQNDAGQFIDANGQVIQEFVTGANGQQIRNPALVPVTISNQDRDAAIGNVLNAAAQRTEAAQRQTTALGTLGENQAMLRDWLTQLQNDPDRQRIFQELWNRSVFADNPEPTIPDELVQRNYAQVERLILREFGQEMNTLGTQLGAAGLAESPFLISLRDQLRARSLEARETGLLELQTWQNSVNAQYQALYTDQLLKWNDSQTALEKTIRGLMLGVREQIASVQLGQTFSPIDLAPLAEMMDALGSVVGETQRMFSAQNPDIWQIIGETVSGLLTTYLPILGERTVLSLSSAA